MFAFIVRVDLILQGTGDAKRVVESPIFPYAHDMKEKILSRRALNRALLARQMLLAREEISALGAVHRLVGLQAQQAQPPFIGLWTRLARFERAELARLIHGREVIRAPLMRGTLHLMTAADYLSFRGALQPALSAGMRSVLRDRTKTLDIPAITAAARRYFGEQPRTFTELRAALMGVFPSGDERAMGYAARMHLPLVVVPDDSGWAFRSDANFALAESWLGKPPATDERPHELVMRYLAAFGPASATDVQAWSALAGIREVLEELRPQLVTFRDDRKRELFDLPDAPRPSEDTPAPARFLPGFDNLILSHCRSNQDHGRRAPAAGHHEEPPGPADLPGRRLRRRHLEIFPCEEGSPPDRLAVRAVSQGS